MQVTGAEDTWTGTPTELVAFDPQGSDDLLASPLYCATVFGIGDDNPTDPYMLTELQKSRSFIVLLTNTSNFQVQYHLYGCCSTGRKYVLP